MKLTAKRYEALKHIDGHILIFDDGPPTQFYVDGADENLHPATCHWLIRNKLIAWDREWNERQELCSMIGFSITNEGQAALRVNGPKATVLKFRPRAA